MIMADIVSKLSRRSIMYDEYYPCIRLKGFELAVSAEMSASKTDLFIVRMLDIG